MFRRSKDHRGQPTEAASTYAGRPGQQESMRVLAAFLSEPTLGVSTPGPGPAISGPGPVMGATTPGTVMGAAASGSAMGAATSGPVPGAASPGPAPPLAVTGWAASPPPPPALNIRPLIGAENSYPNLPAAGNEMSLPIPGIGPVSADRLEQVYTHVNDLVTRLSGGADLSQRWTPDQVRTALAGLEVEHSQARLTEEQYQALRAALESMLLQ